MSYITVELETKRFEKALIVAKGLGFDTLKEYVLKSLDDLLLSADIAVSKPKAKPFSVKQREQLLTLQEYGPQSPAELTERFGLTSASNEMGVLKKLGARGFVAEYFDKSKRKFQITAEGAAALAADTARIEASQIKRTDAAPMPKHANAPALPESWEQSGQASFYRTALQLMQGLPQNWIADALPDMLGEIVFGVGEGVTTWQGEEEALKEGFGRFAEAIANKRTTMGGHRVR